MMEENEPQPVSGGHFHGDLAADGGNYYIDHLPMVCPHVAVLVAQGKIKLVGGKVHYWTTAQQTFPKFRADKTCKVYYITHEDEPDILVRITEDFIAYASQFPPTDDYCIGPYVDLRRSRAGPDIISHDESFPEHVRRLEQEERKKRWRRRGRKMRHDIDTLLTLLAAVTVCHDACCGD